VKDKIECPLIKTVTHQYSMSHNNNPSKSSLYCFVITPR